MKIIPFGRKGAERSKGRYRNGKWISRRWFRNGDISAIENSKPSTNAFAAAVEVREGHAADRYFGINESSGVFDRFQRVNRNASGGRCHDEPRLLRRTMAIFDGLHDTFETDELAVPFPIQQLHSLHG